MKSEYFYYLMRRGSLVASRFLCPERNPPWNRERRFYHREPPTLRNNRRRRLPGSLGTTNSIYGRVIRFVLEFPSSPVPLGHSPRPSRSMVTLPPRCRGIRAHNGYTFPPMGGLSRITRTVRREIPQIFWILANLGPSKNQPKKALAGSVSPASCGTPFRSLCLSERIRPTAIAVVRVHSQTVAWVSPVKCSFHATASNRRRSHP